MPHRVAQNYDARTSLRPLPQADACLRCVTLNQTLYCSPLASAASFVVAVASPATDGRTDGYQSVETRIPLG